MAAVPACGSHQGTVVAPVPASMAAVLSQADSPVVAYMPAVPARARHQRSAASQAGIAVPAGPAA